MSSTSHHQSSTATISLLSTLVSNIPSPSSTFSLPSLSSPSDSSEPSQSSTPGQNGDLALYLYTFLATLILLLSVSSAIVIRSLIIRRRHNRMIAEAIANGTWFPNAANDDHHPGEKPGFFEAFVSGAGAGGRPKDGGGVGGNEKAVIENRGEKEDIDWQDIMPFSATYLIDDTDTDGSKPVSTPIATTATTTSPQTPLSARHRFASAFRRVRARATPAPLLPLPVSARAANPPSPFLLASPSPSRSARDEEPSSPMTPTPTPSAMPIPVPSTIRVAVLIAMPVPPPAAAAAAQATSVYGNEEEEEIPHVEFGVADVEVVAGNDGGES